MKVVIKNYKELKADCIENSVNVSHFYKIFGNDMEDFGGIFGYEWSEKTTRLFTFEFIGEDMDTRYFRYIGMMKC